MDEYEQSTDESDFDELREQCDREVARIEINRAIQEKVQELAKEEGKNAENEESSTDENSEKKAKIEHETKKKSDLIDKFNANVKHQIEETERVSQMQQQILELLEKGKNILKAAREKVRLLSLRKDEVIKEAQEVLQSNSELKNPEEGVKKLTVMRRQFKAEIEGKRAQLRELKSLNEILDQGIDSKEEKISELHKTEDELRLRQQSLEHELPVLKTKEEELRAKVEASNVEVEICQNECQVLNKKICKIREEMAETENCRMAVLDEVSIVELKTEELNAALASKKLESGRLQQGIYELKEASVKWKNKLSAELDEINKEKQRIEEESGKRLDEMNRNIEAAKRRTENSLFQINEYRARMQKKIEYGRNNDLLLQKQLTLSLLKEETAKLKALKLEKTEFHSKKKIEIEAFDAEYRARKAELSREITRCREDDAALRMECASLQKKITEGEIMLKTAQQNLEHKQPVTAVTEKSFVLKKTPPRRIPLDTKNMKQPQTVKTSQINTNLKSENQPEFNLASIVSKPNLRLPSSNDGNSSRPTVSPTKNRGGLGNSRPLNLAAALSVSPTKGQNEIDAVVGANEGSITPARERRLSVKRNSGRTVEKSELKKDQVEDKHVDGNEKSATPNQRKQLCINLFDHDSSILNSPPLCQSSPLPKRKRKSAPRKRTSKVAKTSNGQRAHMRGVAQQSAKKDLYDMDSSDDDKQ